MTADLRSPDGEPNYSPQRRSGKGFWISTSVIVCLLAVTAAGFAWHFARPENRYRRAREAFQSGDAETVLRESRRLMATPGYEPYGRLLAGMVLVKAGRPSQSLPELLIASRDPVTAVEAMTYASEAFYSMGQFADAIYTARRALDVDPSAIDARRWLAVSYYDLGAALDAVAELKIVSAQDPQDPRSERLLGLIAKDTERFGEAVEHYSESLRRNADQPDRQEILVELAESLVRLNRFEDALSTLGDADESAVSLTLKAECIHPLGRIDEAVQELHRALELDPQHVPARLKLGTLLLSQARSQEAVDVLKVAEPLEPYNSRLQFQLSQAYRQLGRASEADTHLNRMRESQALEQEFTQLHEAASEDPNDADVRYRIGVVARKLGRRELARLWFRAALSLNPEHRQAEAALSRLEGADEQPLQR